MKIKELINNGEFCFNPEFMIKKYTFEEDEEETLYDSRKGEELPFGLDEWSITSIDQTNDVIEIFAEDY